MNRRHLLAAGLAVAAAPRMAFAAPAFHTRWSVRGSEGFDALCFLGPLSGKPFYASYYTAELADFLPRFPKPAAAALATLQAAADARGVLLGPTLCLLFSGGADATLDDLIANLDAAETRLKPAYRASAYWDADDWAAFTAGRPLIRAVLAGLREADFPGLRRRFVAGKLAARIPALKTRVAGLDVIGEQQRLLGRPLPPSLEIILLWFSKPHGIRVQGQRFLTHVDYPDQIVLRNAAHEVFHPPFPMQGPAARAALAVLGADPLIGRIVAEHDPAFGYNSLPGYFEEDTVQALEQVVSERLGFASPPASRWKADDGMHVLAAGLYGLLKADGFDRTGGRIEAWIGAAAAGAGLAPGPLHAAAAAVLQVPPDGLWPRKLA
ncbi:MAG: hypothetical protein E7812_18205 [Phenylobacterium sp.]|nr:MAG: hypothetical protein E7812_18205 [Phenylobacterium sp.]